MSDRDSLTDDLANGPQQESIGNRRMLEFELPIEKISSLAEHEANGRKTIYRVHKWWARRLGTVFRSLLVAALMDSSASTNQFLEAFESETKIGKGRVVLDSFMGGGTTAVEALRLGSKVIGVDINPVSWFITKKEVEPVKLNIIRKEFEKLRKTVGKEILEFYSTECPNDHEAEIIYALWNYKAKCLTCKRESSLFKNHIVLERKISQGEVDFVLHCEYCGNIFSSHIQDTQFCPKCNKQVNPSAGNTLKGKFKCTCGSNQMIVDMVKEQNQPLNQELFAIEYDCLVCGRGFKAPSESDLKKFQEIQEKFEKTRDSLLFPKEQIQTSESDKRPVNHGYRYFYQLFNARQLLSLSALIKEIMQIRDISTREFLLLAFSACLETNNLLCKYETKWDKISAAFAIPAYHPTERIAENNVWGGRYGRGTFVKCYRKLLLAKGVSLRTRNDGDVEYIPIEVPYHFTNVARSYRKLKSDEQNALLKCSDAERMNFVPSGSIDIVLTDPPYFDNFTYSRLSDFFYVWLRIALSDIYPRTFGSSTSRRKQEIVLEGNAQSDLDMAVKGLSKVFSECNRVLKQEGILAFTFHHTQTWAWEGLYNAIEKSGLRIVNTLYIRSESTTGYRKEGKISYDACIICKKESIEPNRASLSMIRKSSMNWVRQLMRAGNGLHDADLRCIAIGEVLRFDPLLLKDKDLEIKIENVTSACIRLRDRIKIQDERKVYESIVQPQKKLPAYNSNSDNL